MIIHGDCLEVLRGMEADSVDSIVTDPPYGLSFMGKKWDYDVPSVEIWAECLRVLKPGGHLLAFAGTRTQHRMAVRIEDAGFEIRDMIAWVYSSGFPKSMNLDRKRGEVFCGCEGTGKQESECVMRPMRDEDVPQTINHSEKCGEVLWPSLQEQGAPAEGWKELSDAEIRGRESSVEGWCDAEKTKGELYGSSLCASAGLGVANGKGGWLHNGTSPCNGSDVRVSSDKNGSCGSFRPQSIEQSPIEPGPVSNERGSQAWRGWQICSGCSKPIIPKGLGTAIKPALEPITVARKPLVGTVAENVLKHGTGALNIDGCRVATDDGENRARPPRTPNEILGGGKGANLTASEHNDAGRWPANLIHDGSEPAELLGDAARFFYCAKASKRDRDDGLEGFPEKPHYTEAHAKPNRAGRESQTRPNHHPTVKPTDLMRYLCRLVTPPKGTVLDPFAGSGSTGKAAVLEGFNFIGIEREAEYVAIAKARINHVQGSVLL